MNKYFWVVPFLSFLGGYCIMSYFYTPKTVRTPCLVGKTISDALRITASQGLSIRLIKEQEDPELPTGTVMVQNPLPQTHMKTHQAIHCIISKKTELRAPQIVGKKVEEVKNELDQLGISLKAHAIASNLPEGICIAQEPAPKAIMSSKTIQIYIAQGNLQQFLFPDLRQKSIEDVRNFLSSIPAIIKISHALEQPEDHICNDCIVSDQRPKPGAIVSFDKEKPIQVQLVATPVVNSNARIDE